MPEIITKYPDIVLQILRESGAECGTGAAQKILTACPPERFCSLPTGEICVYGLNEIPQMTQISAGEIAQVVSAAPLPIFTSEAMLLAIATFAIGVVLGILLCKRRKIVRKGER
ncbi:MAG: hypothetical protein WC613_04660 [Candidatus Aenigmatarchaeota archaeon]